MSMKVLGVIPARGGSKGIPRKNIFPIAGKPLIQYSIEEARKSAKLTHCIISTDDDEIAQVARACGGDAPFKRPPHLATDHAQSYEVVIHALEFMEARHKIEYDVIVLLQPTTPLRRSEDIDQAISILENYQADSVVTLCDVGAMHPSRMYYIGGQAGTNKMRPLLPEGSSMIPRQELEKVFIRSGDIYAISRASLLANKSLIGIDPYALEIPLERSINIDSWNDLYLFERYVSLHG